MNRSRNRKIAYLLSIVVLFTAMIGVGQRLEWEQDELDISQKSLGKVNPVSGTAQLVLGGLRGVAVTVLWHEAQELQKKRRYFDIEPVVRSITLLQPHFQSPWEFQAWNIAFNIAGEWEAVSDKYDWIRKGVDFMKEATEVNRNKADLDWYVGFIYFARIGQSDEHVYLREMFREDPDKEYTTAESGIQDNYEVSYDWHKKANNICFDLNQRPKRMAPHPFLSRPALCKSFYGRAMQEEGTFGDLNIAAWKRALREWIDFGLLGGAARDKYMMYRLEFTDAEYAALTPEQKHWVERYNDVVQYRFWKTHCATEAEKLTQDARQEIYEADTARKNGEYNKAVEHYEKGLALWREILEKNETYREDMTFREDCQDMEDHYLTLLSHIGKPTPVRRPFDGVIAPKNDAIYDIFREREKEMEAQENEPPKAPSGEEPPKAGAGELEKAPSPPAAENPTG